MGFVESARRGGSGKRSSFAMYSVETKCDYFQCSKKCSAPSAPEFIITASWSFRLSSFPEPLLQFWGALLTPRPPVITPTSPARSRGFAGFIGLPRPQSHLRFGRTHCTVHTLHSPTTTWRHIGQVAGPDSATTRARGNAQRCCRSDRESNWEGSAFGETRMTKRFGNRGLKGGGPRGDTPVRGGNGPWPNLLNSSSQLVVARNSPHLPEGPCAFESQSNHEFP